MTTLAELQTFMADNGYHFFNMSAHRTLGTTITLRVSKMHEFRFVTGRGETFDEAFADIRRQVGPRKPSGFEDLIA